MKVIIEVNTENREEIIEGANLLLGMVGLTGTVTMGTAEDKPKEDVTPEVEEKTAEEAPKPKRTRKKKVVEPEPEVAPEPKSSITLAELKTLAQEAVARRDRIVVKVTIGQYGAKLTEVKEADYAKLAEALKAL